MTQNQNSFQYINFENIYVISGKTDMRKGIDGLATIIQDTFKIDLYSNSMFLFAGIRKDRYKTLYFDGNGFAVTYKRIDSGRLQWPKDDNQIRKLSEQEFRWLLEGLSLEQPKAIQASPKGVF